MGRLSTTECTYLPTSGSHARERSETHTDIRSTLRGKVQSVALVLEASISASLSNSPRLFWDQ